MGSVPGSVELITSYLALAELSGVGRTSLGEGPEA